MSSTVYVRSAEYRVPAVCASCGNAAAPGWDAGKTTWFEVSSSSTSGNTTTTAKMKLPLCPECATARARIQARETEYPGKWWPISLSIAAALGTIVWFFLVQSQPNASLTYYMCYGSIGLIAAAVGLGAILKRRNDKLNPPDPADAARVAAIASSVAISAPGAGPISTISFTNDAVAEVWRLANPQAEILAQLGSLRGF